MPATRTSAIQPDQFATFGQLLRFLRQRAGLTQRELSIAVGYSESQMSRLEQNQRAPDETALAARFVPALHLEQEPGWVARLLELGAASRAEGQPDEPAPANPAPAAPNNLPAQLTSFIGREQELAEIQQLLTPFPNPSPSPERRSSRSGEGEGWRASAREGVRLLTLTGPGGTGKTRLALQAAAALLAAFPDGVWWVELAPLMDPALIPQSVAAVLGLKEEPDRPLLATLVDHLRGKQALLILDNCEHLIQASAQFAEALLRACPRVCLLASSRELLGVAGERALSVPSLRTPQPNESTSPDALRRYEAVRLFVDRAMITAPHFALTPANAPAVIQVCRRLDGIPLALELAAARLRLLPVEQLAARLDDAFRLLTGGSRTALPRHQTLQALIDWSYELLPEAEQKLMRRLAVFAGGWTLEAAEAVCAGEGLEAQSVANLLGRLIDKSLVLVEEQVGAARYRLMETVRQYAQAKLAASGEADNVRRRHAEYYLALVEIGQQSPADQLPDWLDQIELEHDNLRAALGWSQLAPDRVELALRLSIAVGWRWYSGRSFSEAKGWLESILAQPEAANYPSAHALALVNFGQILSHQGDFQAGETYFAQSSRLYRELGNGPMAAYALDRLGWAAREQGHVATARAWSEECLALCRTLGGQSEVCGATNTLGEVLILQGDLVRAKTMLSENLVLARQLADVNLTGWALNHLGHIAQIEGDFEQATRLHEASLPVFHQLGLRHGGHIWAHHGLGETALAQRDALHASTHFAEALGAARDLGDQEALAWCLAGVAAVNEEPERAAWLWGAAEALRRSLGVREAPASHATHERLKAQVCEALGQAVFAAAWAAGQAAPLSAAIERALQPEPAA